MVNPLSASMLFFLTPSYSSLAVTHLLQNSETIAYKYMVYILPGRFLRNIKVLSCKVNKLLKKRKSQAINSLPCLMCRLPQPQLSTSKQATAMKHQQKKGIACLTVHNLQLSYCHPYLHWHRYHSRLWH